MTATPPDDVAAMFDLPPLPAAAPSTPQDAEAAEAALAAEMAAELASAIESGGGVAADAPDSRTDRRVEVSWPARMHLADGRVIELEVRDVSENGVGLVSAEDIPACTVVGFEMSVPAPDEGGSVTPVKGALKTTYTVVQGAEILCGGTWEAPPAGLELVGLWVERLRR